MNGYTHTPAHPHTRTHMHAFNVHPCIVRTVRVCGWDDGHCLCGSLQQHMSLPRYGIVDFEERMAREELKADDLVHSLSVSWERERDELLPKPENRVFHYAADPLSDALIRRQEQVQATMDRLQVASAW